jgi:hypothetical protein
MTNAIAIFGCFAPDGGRSSAPGCPLPATGRGTCGGTGQTTEAARRRPRTAQQPYRRHPTFTGQRFADNRDTAARPTGLIGGLGRCMTSRASHPPRHRRPRTHRATQPGSMARRTWVDARTAVVGRGQHRVKVTPVRVSGGRRSRARDRPIVCGYGAESTPQIHTAGGRCRRSGPAKGRRRWRSSSPRARSSPSRRVGSADPVSGRCTAGSRRSKDSAWRRVVSCQAPYRCRTRVRSWGVVMNAAASARERRSVPVRGRPNASRATLARQVHNQRSRYAGAVLRSLARSQQGRPTAQIQHLLRNSLTPLGVRLSSASLHQLATDIAAGRPVALS